MISVAVLRLFFCCRSRIALSQHQTLFNVMGLSARERVGLFNHFSDAEFLGFQVLKAIYDLTEVKCSCCGHEL